MERARRSLRERERAKNCGKVYARTMGRAQRSLREQERAEEEPLASRKRAEFSAEGDRITELMCIFA